jgi:hypothetical protein
VIVCFANEMRRGISVDQAFAEQRGPEDAEVQISTLVTEAAKHSLERALPGR